MLSEQLTQQLELIHGLHQILEQERICLQEKDFSQLNDILVKKQNSLNVIAELDKVFSNTSSQNEISQNEKLLALKTKIEEQLTACQKINSVNGKIIELSMRSNKHLMQLMKQATGKNSITYDQKGGLSSGSLLGRNIKA